MSDVGLTEFRSTVSKDTIIPVIGIAHFVQYSIYQMKAFWIGTGAVARHKSIGRK